MSNKPNKADLFIEKKELYNKADIADDKGFVNSNTDSSVVAKSDGNNVIALTRDLISGTYSGCKILVTEYIGDYTIAESNEFILNIV